MESEKTSYQGLFEQLLALQGQTVEVGDSRTGKSLRGEIVYVMFDSFLISVKGKNEVIRFKDLMYFNSLS